MREVLARDGEVIEGHTMLGNLQVKARRYDAAVAAYRAALALDPEHQGATFSLALTYKLQERYDDAAAGFERALALDPRNTKAQFQLADIWMRRGRFDRAEPLLRAALERKVDRPAFLVKLGECLIETKRYAEAEAALREAIAAQPDAALAHYDLGLVLEAKGEAGQAMREYEAELARNPKAYRASFNLGKLLLAAGTAARRRGALPRGGGGRRGARRRAPVPGEGAARHGRRGGRPGFGAAGARDPAGAEAAAARPLHPRRRVHAAGPPEGRRARGPDRSHAGTGDVVSARSASAVLLALAALAAACSGPKGAPARGGATPRHLVLVTIDTLRADRLGCYGSRDVATPRIDRIAAQGALAPQAVVHVPLTRPSHVSLFSGLYPAESGVRDNVSPPLGREIPTLASTLKAAGFHTAAFVSSIVVGAQSGLNRGFDTFSDRFELDGDDARFLNTIQRRGDGPTAEAIAWLEAQREGRLFAWVHLYDPHDPYEPPEPYATRYAGRPYDGEVAWSDELVGRLDDALARLHLDADTLLVVTSDHGEGLGEHGESVHGFFVYQSTLRVPLLVRGPGIPAGSRLGVTARGVDLMPTLLELLDVKALPRLSGRSLARALRGLEKPAEEPSYAESLVPLLHFGWSDLRTLSDGRFKYIQAPRPELYDLKQDPRETRDLAASEPARAQALRRGLEGLLAKERTSVRADPGAPAVPPDLLEKLGALGYLGAGAPSESAATGADPKDKIEEYKVLNRLVREGLRRLREKDFKSSAASFEELLRRGISSFEVHYYLARALVGLKRYAAAAPHFERALERLPAYGAAALGLADCRIAAGDLEGALAALEKGRQASPKDPSLPERAGQVWRRRRHYTEAARAYEAAVALAPGDALLRVQLGETYRDAGRTSDAVRLLREAVALDAGKASYWNSLGMVLGAGGEMAEAEKAFRQASERDGANAEYAYNLGLALMRLDRGPEAAVMFRRTLELDPRFRSARLRLAELADRSQQPPSRR